MNPSGATLSNDSLYRYRLWRVWDYGLPRLLYVMLNPSTADAMIDDQTIKKCRGFASRLGFGGIEVVNLFAFRVTKPKDLFAAIDPVGRSNDFHISTTADEVLSRGGEIVCAWGSNAKGHPREREVRDLLFVSTTRAKALRINGDGTPAHPLMLPFSERLKDYML